MGDVGQDGNCFGKGDGFPLAGGDGSGGCLVGAGRDGGLS